MTFSAIVEYNDREGTEEIRGYQNAKVGHGVVQFVWDDQLLTVPLHRIKSITETGLKE